jgi:hypothetical protein
VVMICRHLLSLIKSAPKAEPQPTNLPQAQPLKNTTNRSLADGFQEWTRKVRLNGQEQAGILASLKKPGAAGGQ